MVVQTIVLSSFGQSFKSLTIVKKKNGGSKRETVILSTELKSMVACACTSKSCLP